MVAMMQEYSIPHFYDLLDNSAEAAQANINFFLHYALRAKAALEIGAGTGRVAIPLAERGVQVTCVEPSAAMRSAMLTKIAQKPEIHQHITVLPGEAGSFTLDQQFPLIYAAGVQNYFHADDEHLAMLRNVHKHLTNDGIFIIDSLSGTLDHKDQPLTEAGTHSIGEVDYKMLFERKVLSPSLFKVTFIYETQKHGEVLEREESSLIGRIVSRAEIHDFLAQSGFVVTQEYACHDFTPFSEGDENLIIEARKQ